jgi:hypothetical protein
VFGRWVIVTTVILILVAYVSYVRLLRPLIERLSALPEPKAPAPPQFKLY